MPRLGKYELVRKLDAGGMAELYLARQEGTTELEKTVVLKRLHTHLLKNEEVVQMFINEARIASRLHHPNIIHIFDLGFTEQSYFLAMEHVWGHNLREVQEQGAERSVIMPYGLVTYIVSQICSALHYAHAFTDEEGRHLHIVHRDVSPDNVLLGFSGVVKLGDFGIAQATTLAAETHAGLLKGKCPYMSPEQCKGEKLDARSDIFSAGILLYELTCRRRLFRRHNDVATMRAIVEDPIPPPSKVIDDFPDELEKITMRALARSVDERYQDAGQMQSDLERAMAENGWQIGADQAAGHMASLYADELKALGGKDKPAFFDVPTLETNLDPHGRRKIPSDEFSSMPTAPSTPFHISLQPLDPPVLSKDLAEPSADREDEPTDVWHKLPQAEAVSPSGKTPEPEEELLISRSAVVQDQVFTEVPTEAMTPQSRLASQGDSGSSKTDGSAAGASPISPPELPRTSQERSFEEFAKPPVGAGSQQRLETNQLPPATVTNKKLVMVIAMVFAMLLVTVGILAYRLVTRGAGSEAGGQVDIKTVPSGATVYLNSKKQFETTPITIFGVPLGQKNLLVLMKEGFGSWRKTFTLDEDRPKRAFTVKLQGSGPGGPPATLVVQVQGEGARVFFNGELKGEAPLNLEQVPSGIRHVVVIKKAGFDDKTLELEPLSPKERRTIHVDLHSSESKLEKGVKRIPRSHGKEDKGPIEVPRPKIIVPPLEDWEVGERIPKRSRRSKKRK